jgi:hypothetical protein
MTARAASTATTAALVLAVAALAVACGAGGETTSLGYVVAPSVPAEPPAVPPAFAAFADAGPSAYRPLPPEPVALGCTREILCQREEEEVPAVPYPPPFERCSDRYLKGAVMASFSGPETRRARQTDPTTCCYVELRNCARPR